MILKTKSRKSQYETDAEVYWRHRAFQIICVKKTPDTYIENNTDTTTDNKL